MGSGQQTHRDIGGAKSNSTNQPDNGNQRRRNFLKMGTLLAKERAKHSQRWERF
jgi:hypothetical protein